MAFIYFRGCRENLQKLYFLKGPNYLVTPGGKIYFFQYFIFVFRFSGGKLVFQMGFGNNTWKKPFNF